MAKPIKFWRNKGIDVTAWPTKNGSVSFSIRKTYKPKDSNEYVESKSYFPNEIKDLLNLLVEAHGWSQEFFGEEPKQAETRPVTPAVQKLVDGIAKSFPGAKPVEDDLDIPF